VSTAARDLLAAFDHLPPDDKQEVAVEILRRLAGMEELPDSGYEQLADQVFAAYDAEEMRIPNL
jgi:hypothetical protein